MQRQSKIKLLIILNIEITNARESLQDSKILFAGDVLLDLYLSSGFGMLPTTEKLT